MSEHMTPMLKKLMVRFLKEYATLLARQGCNDWEWPEWLPVEERLLILKALEADGYEGEGVPPDFCVVGILATLLDQEESCIGNNCK
jgi:hypothetical protein